MRINRTDFTQSRLNLTLWDFSGYNLTHEKNFFGIFINFDINRGRMWRKIGFGTA